MEDFSENNLDMNFIENDDNVSSKASNDDMPVIKNSIKFLVNIRLSEEGNLVISPESDEIANFFAKIVDNAQETIEATPSLISSEKLHFFTK